jgi:beta-N-acetylhexosaminidase
MLRVPPPGPPRRRLTALAVAGLLALVAGIVVGAGGGEPAPEPSARATKPQQRAAKRAQGLSLERQVGEVLMIAFKGPGVPSYVKRALREGRAGGVVLFRGNAGSPAEMRDVTSQLQRSGRRGVLIAADQEGGPVRILPWAAPAAAQTAQATPSAAFAQARLARRDLAASGVNVTLAPVADVASPGSVMRGRAFPGGTEDVAAIAASAVRGWRGGRVAPTLKHFPGLGAAGRNTDDVPVTISSPRAALAARDLPPFAAAIRAGAPLVMASHATYSGLDPRHIASQSPAILRDLLRKRLGFKGVVITDSMEADASLKTGPIEVAALRSVAAGADLLLLTGPGSFPRVYRQLLVGAKRSGRFRARIADAAARVIALKRSLGLRTG